MAANGYLRRVQEKDRELLFEWINDPVTRSQSFSSAGITWEEHAAWFAKKMADPDCQHFLFMAEQKETAGGMKGCGEGGSTACQADGRQNARSGGGKQNGGACPAGVIRMERDGDSGVYVISYSIAPKWRGRGYGALLLTLAEKWAAALLPDCSLLFGEVMEENAASARCFEKAGYRRGECGRKTAGHGQTARSGQKVLCFQKEIRHEGLVYFRADANGRVGWGHIMRCLTIADACEKEGMRPVFVMADAGEEEKVAGRGFPSLILGTDYRRMEKELPKLPGLLQKGTPIVLDSYFLTRTYTETLLKNGHKLAWLDDLGEADYPVDLLINYNFYAPRLSYRIQDTETRYLLGADYAPVRQSFCAGDYVLQKELDTVLVTTGASDPYGAGVFFARELKRLLPGAKLRVVCGPYAAGRDELYAFAGQTEGVEILEGLSDLSGVMRGCDFAVAAAGSTFYELCAVGVPAVAYYFADNQRQGAEAFARLAGSVSLGDMRRDCWRTEAGKLLADVTRRMRDAGARRTLSEAMHALVDGKGAARIAAELAKLVFDR